MDAVRQLILDRAAELELPLSDLSKKVGNNHAWLHQFIYRGKSASVPEEYRPTLAKELKVQEQDLRGPESPPVNQQSPPDEFPIVGQRGVDNVGNPTQDRALTTRIPESQLTGERDLPVRRTTAQKGGKGAVILSSEPVDYVARPGTLARVQGGFGILLTDDLMFPAYEAGDTVHVHPHLPARPGQTCVFERVEDGVTLVYVRYLRKQTDDVWHVTEWNSDGKRTERDFTLKKADWTLGGVIVGHYKGLITARV